MTLKHPGPVLVRAPRAPYCSARHRSGALALMLATACSSVLAQQPGAARAVESRSSERLYQIAAGPLSASLPAFAAQAGISVSAPSALLAGKQGRALQGKLGVDQAFVSLLEGTGLQAVHQGNGDYILRERDVVPAAGNNDKLPAVVVTAGVERSAVTEGSGSYTTGSMSTATGLGLSMRDTPQSVSVVTRQRMEDERLQTLDDVLRATTGLTSTYNGSGRALWYARGERIQSLQIDGLPLSISDGFSTDSLSLPATVLYDHIEIVRGANGLMQGSGNPSAAVNMVRKRPTREKQVAVELSAGSWSTYAAQIDAGGPLNEAGTLRARGVLYGTDGNSYQQDSSKDNKLGYGILEADLTPDTMLTAGLVLQNERNRGYDWGGLPTRIDGSFYPFSASTTLIPDWTFLNKRNQQVFAELTHQFNDDWKLTFSANKISAKAAMMGRSLVHTNAVNDQLSISNTDLRYTDERENFGLHLQGAYELLGRRHELMVGANVQHTDWYYWSAGIGVRTPFDPWNFNLSGLPYPTAIRSTSYESSRRKDTGVYMATRFDLPFSTKLILGGRFSWVDYVSKTSWSSASYKATREFTPYAGLVHELSPTTSAYASYTEIFQPQSQRDVTGQLLPPVTGSNYELGVKGEFFGGKLNASAALFQTVQNNLPKGVANNTNCFSMTMTCYEASDKVRNRGLEFDISGELLPGWSIAAGYTYNVSKYAAGGSVDKDYNTYLPRHLVKLATTWQLPGAMQAWKVGANMQAQSSIYQDQTTTGYQSYNYGAIPYRVEQKAYQVYGLMASYQFDRSTEVQLNLNNVFNKLYYSTIGGTNWGNHIGTPRNGAVTLRMKF